MSEFNGRIGHLYGIESPWGNAGGVVKTVEDVEQMARTGVGWIEGGSYTLEERAGNGANGERVYYHDPARGETFNSLGMPNKGMDAVEAEIPEMSKIARSYHKKLIVNVAPVSEEPVKEAVELIARSYAAGADGVVLNAGCPNVVLEDGGRHEILSYNPPGLAEVLNGIYEARFDRPIMIRISPPENYAKAIDIFAVIRSSRVVSAVFDPNTWPGHKPLDTEKQPLLEVPGGVGGKSGPAMAFMSAKQTEWAVKELQGSGIDVVRSSGVMDATELQRSFDIGAVAAAGTTFFYESRNGWQEDVGRLLTDLAA